MRVSEIHVKKIRVNQGLGVQKRKKILKELVCVCNEQVAAVACYVPGACLGIILI